MKRTASYAIIVSVAVTAGFAMFVYAAIPEQINYQSRLRTSAGAPVTTATSISFALYSASSGGTALWAEARNQVSGSCAKVTPDADGYFSVQLGSCASFPASLSFDAPLFLGVTIGSDAEATPRVSFSPSPYTMNAVRLGTFAADPANSKVIAETTGTATGGTTGFNSSALTLRGSGWNGSSAQTRDVTIRNIVTSGSSSRLGIFNNAGTEIVSVLDSGAIGVGVTNPMGAMEVAGDFYADRLLVRGGTVFNSFNASTNSDQTSFTRPRYFIGSATSTSDLNPKNLVQYEATGTTFLEDAVFSKLASITNRQIKFGSNTLTFPATMPASNGQVLSGTTAGALSWVDGSSGTVTSVGLALPNIFSVANSPIISSGTTTASLVSQAGNTFFAAPDGASGTPSFRAIVAADIPALATSSIPNLNADKITSGVLPIARGGTNLSAYTANGVLYAPTSSSIGQVAAGSNGEVLTLAGGVPTWASLPGSGTVTSVALTAPSIFSVAGSPITGSGTLGMTLATQNANAIFAGPASGADAAPTFRSLVASDIPALSTSSIPNIDASKITTGVLGVGRIPDLDVSKIVSGVFDIARIPNIPAANITGTLATSSIPNIDANKIATGVLPIARGGTNLSSYIVNGVLYAPTSSSIGQVAAGANGEVLTLAGGVPTWASLPGSGTVTSAGLSLPSIFTVSNSPITSSGTTTASLATQVTKTFFAGPASGADAIPTFRAILAADIPTLNQNTTGTASNITGILGAASFPALTGDVTTGAGSLVTTIGAGRVTNAMLAGSIDAAKISSGTFSLSRLPAGTNGQVLTTVSGAPAWANANAGTVTSVGVTVPSFLSVSGSPVTSAGSLDVTLTSQATGTIFAAPAGSNGAPSFRVLSASDIPALSTSSIPNLDASKITTGILPVVRGGTGLSVAGSNGEVLTVVSGVPVWSALPASGTVTSVGITLPSSVFSVSNSPITGSGTSTATFVSQATSTVFAAPGGGTGSPVFRTLMPSDIPNLNASKINTGVLGVDVGGTGLGVYAANGVLYASGAQTITQVAAGANGNVLTLNESGAPAWSALPASGTVTSAGIALPSSVFSVSGSPITSSGTSTATFIPQTAKTFFAGPASGADAIPTFRTILAADIPTLNQDTTGTASNITGILGAASFPALTGDVTTGAGSLVTTIGAGRVTNAMLAGSIDAAKISSGTFSLSRLPAGTNGQVLTTVLGAPVWANANAGTVTSVGVTVPSFLSVSGSPVTSAGTVAISIPNQNPNFVFAGPNAGVTALQPAFRALVPADIPNLNASKINAGTLATAQGGTGLGSFTANGVLYAPTASTIGQVTAGANGNVLTLSGGVPTWSSLPASGDISGIGTTSTIAMFSGAKQIGNSGITQSGGNIDITSGSLSFAGATRITTAGVATFATTTVSGTNQFASNNVAIGGGTINGTIIGGATPSAGTFSALTSTGNVSVGLSVLPTVGVSSIGSPAARFVNLYANELNVGATTTINGISYKWPGSAPVNGTVLTAGASGLSWTAGASGTVTSAGLSLPSIFTVSNSPITSSGTTTASLATQVTKTFFAGPASGADAIPTFRAILAADIPTLNQNTTGTASNITGILGAASFPALTGDVTTGAGSLVTTIGAGRVTNAMLAGSIDAAKISSGTFSLSRLPAGTNGQVLTTVSGAPAWANANAGTVTSVGVTVPSFLSVSGSPITSAGTVAISIPNQNSNVIFAGPGAGASAQPAFRALVEEDIPNLSVSKITAGTFGVVRGGTGLSSYTANGLLYASASSTIGQVAAGANGNVLTLSSGVPVWTAPAVAGWGLTGNAGTVNGTSFIGTTDNVPLALRVNNIQVANFTANSAVILGGGTVTSGGVVLGGQSNAATGGNIIVGGSINSTVSGSGLSVVAGGTSNTISANGLRSFIGGGFGGVLGGLNTAIIGGLDNSIISAGGANPADQSVIAGGMNNTIRSSSSFIGGGASNTINLAGTTGAIIGGAANTIAGDWSVIVGSHRLQVGSNSFGFNAQSGAVSTTDISSMNNVAYFGNADVVIGNTVNAARAIRLYEPNSSLSYSGTNFTAFKAQAQGADITYTLPAAAPSANGQALTATTAGVLSWAAPAVSAPSGWVSSGGNVTLATSTDRVGIGTATPNNKLQVTGLINFDDLSQSTYLGYRAGIGRSGNSGNTVLGYDAYRSAGNGGSNTAIGSLALESTTSGNANTGVGLAALRANTTGQRNTAVGDGALQSNVSSDSSTAVGNAALASATGAANTATGHGAFGFTTTGANNAGFGSDVFGFNTIGSRNTAVGSGAGLSGTLTNTNDAVFVGYQALATANNLTNVIAIGSGAQATKSNQAVIGNSSITETLMRGVVTDSLRVTGGAPIAGKVLTSDATGNATWQSPAAAGWSLTGNAGTVDGTNFIGTTDGTALTLRTNNIGAFRIQPAATAALGASIIGNPNTTGGSTNNTVAATLSGAFIGSGSGNSVTANSGFVGAGQNNIAGGIASGVVSGFTNTAGGMRSFIGSGNNNSAGADMSAIVAGTTNGIASSADESFIGAGRNNAIGGSFSAIPGGTNLKVGQYSFGFNGGDFSASPTDVSALSKVAYFGNVNMMVGNTDNTARELRFYEPNSNTTFSTTNYTAFKAQAQGADITYTLPAAAPMANGQALTATTAGVLSWATPASGVQVIGGTNISVASGMPETITGTMNTGVGSAAMQGLTSGRANTAVGYTALYGNTTGDYNTALGAFGTLYSNTSGGYNVGISSEAMYSNTTGSNNVAIGYAALRNNVGANGSVAVGSGAGTNSTGANNTAIGSGSGPSSGAPAGITNVTAIGSGAENTKSNQVVIGNSSVVETVLNGDVLPQGDNSQDLGSPTKRWRDIYVGPASIKVVGAGGAIIETISAGTGANAGKLVVKGGDGVERQIGRAAAGNLVQGGNTFGTPAQIGTLDAYGVNIFTNALPRLSIASNGKTNFAEDATFAKAVEIGGAVTFSGLVKIPSNAEAGRVLTSDAAGNATWQLPNAASCEAPVFSGDKTITGDLSVGGISSNLIPSAANTYDLGSAAKPWRDIYVSSSTLKFVDDSGQVDATLSLTKGGDIVLENKETKTRKVLGEGGGAGLPGFTSKVEDGQLTLSATAKDAAIGTEKNPIDVSADKIEVQGLRIATGGKQNVKGKALVLESVDADGKMGAVGFASLTDERVEPLVTRVTALESQVASLQAQFAAVMEGVAALKVKEQNMCEKSTVPVRITEVKGEGWKVTGSAMPIKAVPVKTPSIVPIPAAMPTASVTAVPAAATGSAVITQTKTAGRMINVYGTPPSSDMQWVNIGNEQLQASNSAGAARKGQILSADNFGFSIPANAKIESVSIVASRRSAKGSTADDTVYVLKGGVLMGVDLAVEDEQWPASESALTPATFALPSGAFGLTPADMNGAFSVGIRPTLGGVDQATVGSVSVTVKYTAL